MPRIQLNKPYHTICTNNDQRLYLNNWRLNGIPLGASIIAIKSSGYAFGLRHTKLIPLSLCAEGIHQLTIPENKKLRDDYHQNENREDNPDISKCSLVEIACQLQTERRKNKLRPLKDC